MKFLLTNTRDWDDGKKMTEHLEKLKKAGFTIYQVRTFPGNFTEHYIEIGSLEDLMKIADLVENFLIMEPSYKGGPPTIEIYDDYRE